MRSPRTLSVAVPALASLVLIGLAGCSSSASDATTTTTDRSTTTSTTGSTFHPPATGSVDGVTLSVTSSPLTGTAGHTTVTVTAVLTGRVVPSHLTFQVSDAPAQGHGKPATSQRVTVSGPGTYRMPSPFRARHAGTWAVTVTYSPSSAGLSELSVSGLPSTVGSPPPFPQLVTVVTAR